VDKNQSTSSPDWENESVGTFLSDLSSTTSWLDATDDDETVGVQGQQEQPSLESRATNITQDQWQSWDDFVRKKKRKCFAFTLLVDDASPIEGQTTVALLDVGGATLGSMAITDGEREPNDSLQRHAVVLVERHLSPLMEQQCLKLDASDVQFVLGHSGDYLVTVILHPAR
jgi:hypothetical protein